MSHAPTGLFYHTDSICGGDVISQLDTLEWKSVTESANSRRYQHYGSSYDYVSRKIVHGAAPIPEFLLPFRDHLAAKCREHGISDQFNQCIVNDYQPGQGISKHADIAAYGPVIGCFTFGSGATMTFRKGEEIFHQYVASDSLYIMSGESRTTWTHEMPSRKSDPVEGKRVPRSRRVSVTFRYAPL